VWVGIGKYNKEVMWGFVIKEEDYEDIQENYV
jgi:hypothetical protein